MATLPAWSACAAPRAPMWSLIWLREGPRASTHEAVHSVVLISKVLPQLHGFVFAVYLLHSMFRQVCGPVLPI